ncbi:MAG: dihydrodipicolinate reductase, partial [Deltaproteobacteria bacterium]|nr:dihydrodipicolinate reductase [Deltaproteobacteria bacterium]
MNKIKVVQIGIGPLGQKITQFIAQREGIEVVGAVDVSPELIDKDLGEVCGLDSMDIKIQSSTTKCIESMKPDAVILTTVSSMEKITPQIEKIVSYNIPVVSTCEELSYPWNTSQSLSERIDKAAKSKQVAVLGTGVNPGFLMDSLPTFLTSVCQDVQKIIVDRIQDAAFRRIPFQEKIGAGLTLEQFENKKKKDTLRHVGLSESIHL